VLIIFARLSICAFLVFGFCAQANAETPPIIIKCKLIESCQISYAKTSCRTIETIEEKQVIYIEDKIVWFGDLKFSLDPKLKPRIYEFKGYAETEIKFSEHVGHFEFIKMIYKNFKNLIITHASHQVSYIKKYTCEDH